MSESQDWGGLTVILVKSLDQAIYTNELEWESKVGKINSKTRTIMSILVLLLIFPTLDSHSNSFVYIA
jgi:hypothetical protein